MVSLFLICAFSFRLINPRNYERKHWSGEEIIEQAMAWERKKKEESSGESEGNVGEKRACEGITNSKLF